MLWWVGKNVLFIIKGYSVIFFVFFVKNGGLVFIWMIYMVFVIFVYICRVVVFNGIKVSGKFILLGFVWNKFSLVIFFNK